ncbi:UDP-N-acetylmuramate--L-alanine ligase [Sedimentibacter sp. zth1]|uniref:UDP-N-acetylmuramate--L-alanine ligase n=1 Tax=Sedimentibacter sp. zth1 TaxID=2816908 RepID=UPI001A916AE6|nr:UDP-N-acetylmuramate--L-alanine ligase [Sedimentibacter sp. zth1]QSX07014.1 UDP-N-acetylmuramate--L-alanine ligase [Sedimentibacter sp. zth1]
MNKGIKHIYFIGIGGISMSGLAEFMLQNDIQVSGSDRKNSNIIEKLKENGAKIYIGENENNITHDIDLIVYTSAISEDNPEYVKAKILRIKMMNRAEFLGRIMKEHKNSIGVSGTHGKTTTTGMLSQIFVNTDLDPTIFLGGELSVIDGNIRIGQKNLLLTEACEYKRNFLNFNPTMEIILNIDEDHLDYYKDIKDIESAFVEFGHKLPTDGLIVVNEKNKDLFKNMKCRVKTFGLSKKSDIHADNISYLPYPKFTVVYDNKDLCEIELSVFGEHNILNSLSAIAIALDLGIDIYTIKKGLKDFRGTKRRYELKGHKDGVAIIDEYAHHPEAIRATLTSAKKCTNGKVITIFQPHTYTRTKALFEDFAKVFALTDYVIITDIYAAREKDTGLVHSRDLVERIKEYNKNAFYEKNFDDVAALALKFAKHGDIIITMGAGNVNEIDDILLK